MILKFLSILVVFANAAPLTEDIIHSLLTENEVCDMGKIGRVFEGDMILTEAQKQAIANSRLNRNGLRNVTLRWPQNTVVYSIKEGDFDLEQLLMIQSAMKDIEQRSCIRFRPYQLGDTHAVFIKGHHNECISDIGYIIDSPLQMIQLAKGCFKQYGIIIHEILHTLGFYHMQSTYNRDDYVKIIYENIMEESKCNFKAYDSDTVTDFGFPYDYGSVMHYGERDFSKNKQITIVPIQDTLGVQIGQREGMSLTDIIKLNMMYCQNATNETL